MDKSTATPILLTNEGDGGKRTDHLAGVTGAGVSLQASSVCAGAAVSELVAGKRGLQRGLKGRKRTVLLFVDETMLTERPPLRAAWARVGEQAHVAISVCNITLLP